jgi:hypothetical protein
MPDASGKYTSCDRRLVPAGRIRFLKDGAGIERPEKFSNTVKVPADPADKKCADKNGKIQEVRHVIS